MASPLALAAGADDGLDKMLTRLLAEEQLAQKKAAQDEEGRHNRAVEGNSSKQIDLMSKYREDQLAERKDANIVRTVSARGIGDPVTEGEYSTETGAGFPSGDYSIKPGAKVTRLAGFSSAPGSVSKLTGQGEKAATPAGDVDVTQVENDPLNAARSISFRGTEAQRLARDKELRGSPVNVEQKTMLYKGKPTDVLLNPRTQQYFLNGQDITADVSHYEKPPSPDRVLVMSGDGYITRDSARQTLAKGGTVPLATTNTTRTMQEGAQMLQPHIAAVQTMAEKLDADGLFGPVMSRIRDVAAKVGTIDEFNQAIAGDPQLSTDRRVGRFVTSLGLLASGAGRVHGGARGGGSPQMYQAFKELLSASGSLQMFEGRLDGLNEFISGYASGPNAGGGEQQNPAAGDFYQEYLNRKKK